MSYGIRPHPFLWLCAQEMPKKKSYPPHQTITTCFLLKQPLRQQCRIKSDVHGYYQLSRTFCAKLVSRNMFCPG